MTDNTDAGTPIRVALVDDQALFRAGIRMVIQSQPDMEFVGEAGDGREALRLVVETAPDIILMDVRMPVMDGITATKEILARVDASGAHPTRIIVLTTFDLDADAAEALRMGASGFLLKDTRPDLLLAAIRTAHSGSAVIAPGQTQALFAGLAAPEPERSVPASYETLTQRERDVFQLAAKGMSNQEIARTEYVSETTVKTHISRILAKLALRDRVQLVVFAYETGLLSPGGEDGA
ncbi:response regulator [Mycetocola reblochoni]|uniref:Two-component system, regulatory protein n=2 Tax=Mycetocola reblochoni TaxID=331618 RepID=A0A1R4K444_9MICO|nr:response regulator transcription factor [Mycetocola reblochoni]RLP69888.1 DNA-binding response regulator [Mycetocola reblochoni]SJN39019.1 Two-component system, regulatory protein [Mycetocola reblochoni REB411]